MSILEICALTALLFLAVEAIAAMWILVDIAKDVGNLLQGLGDCYRELRTIRKEAVKIGQVYSPEYGAGAYGIRETDHEQE